MNPISFPKESASLDPSDAEEERDSACQDAFVPQSAIGGQFSLLPTTQTTTIVTTTTVTTKFPPIMFKKPKKRLYEWDPTNYPLKDTPTPLALRRFAFDLGGKAAVFLENDESEDTLLDV